MFRSLSVLMVLSIAACSTSKVKKNASDTPGAVANAPGKALNLKKKEIPEQLKELGNPYEVQAGLSCESLQEEIAFLTEFAGPDWDSEEHYTKKGRTASEFADAILPYGGVVRFISGASEHEKKVAYALGYSSVRRAVLKSQAANSGC